MYILKGFMVIQSLSDNTPGVTSALGELSTYSKTFSKDIGHYSRPEQADVDLMAFFSQRDTGGALSVPVAVYDPILEIGQWLYDNAVNGLFGASKSDFLSALLGQYAALLDSVDAGDMVPLAETEENTVWLPQWIRFQMRGTGEENSIKIWFSDEAFRRQYDEYDIQVVPPVDNVDDLFGTPVEVKALLDSINDSERMLRIEEAKEGNPTTRVRVDMFDWSNPLRPDIVLSTSWGILIYGPAGDNVDNIRNRLVEYILANSSHERVEWEDYLPDLFKVTEFILTPLWTNFSIPNETLMAGLYSPTIPLKDLTAIAKTTATRYDDAHVDAVVSTSVSIYRSLAFLAVGGPDNRDGIMTYQERFPDYIVIPSTSAEFGRMSPSTQAWVMRLSQMLKIAEEMTEFSDLPLNMTRLERDGIMYVVSTFEEVQYLVVSKQSYVELFGGGEDDGTGDPGDGSGGDDGDGGVDPGPEPLILTIDTMKTAPDGSLPT